MLNSVQKKRLAKEARKLAMDATVGRARFGRWYSTTRRDEENRRHPSCALSQVCIGVCDTGDLPAAYRDVFAVSVGNPPASTFIFPLLALADELDAQLRAAPPKAATPNTREGE